MEQALRILFMLTLLLGGSRGAVIYDEGVQGDFSDDYLNPALLTLGVGDNVIVGGLSGASQDKDLFTLTILADMQLAEIRVNAFTGGVNGSFMGAQPGLILSDSPLNYIRFGNGEIFTIDPINYVLFGEADAIDDRDIMPQLVVGLPMAGQSPLPAGNYAFWLNETRAGSAYTLNFVVVPEPSSGVLVFLGVLGVGHRRR